jgi:creatinine amidohydrolase
MPSSEKHRYETLTAPEVNDAVDEEKMVVIPVGSTEDHGPHLPLDVDQVLPETICNRTVRNREDALLFPTVTHGFLPHHMPMPGGITIEWKRFVEYLIDIGVSLAHHGFEKILFVNGHGSNHHLVTHAAREIILQYPEVKAANISWWEIHELQETLAEVGDAGPRGSGHAGELETSLYMYIHPDRVDMENEVRGSSSPESDDFYA